MNCDITANLLKNSAEPNVSPETEFGWSSDATMLIFIVSERVLLSKKQYFLKEIKKKKIKGLSHLPNPLKVLVDLNLGIFLQKQTKGCILYFGLY